MPHFLCGKCGWLIYKRGEGRSKMRYTYATDKEENRMKRKRIISCFEAVLLVLVMAMPVFARSGKTPFGGICNGAAHAKNSVTVT